MDRRRPGTARPEGARAVRFARTVPVARRIRPNTIRVIRCGDAGLALCVGRSRAGNRRSKPCRALGHRRTRTVVVGIAVRLAQARTTLRIDFGIPLEEHIEVQWELQPKGFSQEGQIITS